MSAKLVDCGDHPGTVGDIVNIRYGGATRIAPVIGISDILSYRQQLLLLLAATIPLARFILWVPLMDRIFVCSAIRCIVLGLLRRRNNLLRGPYYVQSPLRSRVKLVIGSQHKLFVDRRPAQLE